MYMEHYQEKTEALLASKARGISQAIAPFPADILERRAKQG